MAWVAGLGKPGRRDWLGLGVVLAWTAGLIAYRAVYIEPRVWGALCAAASGAPVACVPREGVLWMQRTHLWSGGAMALGLFAFLFQGPFWVAMAAILLGIGGVENYDATWAMAGLALGVWIWVEGPARRPDA